jgi:hypothetical protein
MDKRLIDRLLGTDIARRIERIKRSFYNGSGRNEADVMTDYVEDPACSFALKTDPLSGVICIQI